MKAQRGDRLVAALLALAWTACSEPRRFEILAGAGEAGGFLVYRLDQETGEMCAFRPFTSEQRATPEALPREVLSGFTLLGCAGAVTQVASSGGREIKPTLATRPMAPGDRAMCEHLACTYGEGSEESFIGKVAAKSLCRSLRAPR